MNTMHSREASLRKKKLEMEAAHRRRRIAGIIAMALVGVLTIGGTVAFLVAQTDFVTNTFTPATVSTEIEESFDKDTKNNVRVENQSDIPVYVRAKVIINWVDANGNVVADVPDGYSYTMSPNPLPPSGSKWVVGPDGYYYYTVALTANDGVEEAGTDETANLVDAITVTRAGDDYDLSVQILTDAIQAIGTTADGVPAVSDAWGVTITEGSVTAYSATTSK